MHNLRTLGDRREKSKTTAIQQQKYSTMQLKKQKYQLLLVLTVLVARDEYNGDINKFFPHSTENAKYTETRSVEKRATVQKQ